MRLYTLPTEKAFTIKIQIVLVEFLSFLDKTFLIHPDDLSGEASFSSLTTYYFGAFSPNK